MDLNSSSLPRAYYTEEEKQQHVQKWIESKQSKQAYSGIQGIKYGTFKNWVNKYHRLLPIPQKESTPGFIALDLGSSSLPPANAYAEIHYPNGSRLIIHKPIAIDELRSLLS